jgi:hypothetical protein
MPSRSLTVYLLVRLAGQANEPGRGARLEIGLERHEQGVREIWKVDYDSSRSSRGPVSQTAVALARGQFGEPAWGLYLRKFLQ